MRITDTADLWWKTAVVYCLDVETWFDADGDGCGDLAGLAQRIDHLAELGVTCLWLMPFYPTPGLDDGYDITDQYGVDPRLGTHGDLVEVVRTARDRGIRVIADLVVNHTSDQHPWFEAARRDRDSPYRGFYVWADEPPPDAEEGVVFPDQEDSTWSYDEEAGQWYQHRFYRSQPDLDVTNPQVRDAVAKVMGFWLQLGLSGFRVDAVPYFLETVGAEENAENGGLPDPHEYLRDLASFVRRRSGDGILLGEVNLPYQEQLRYFGGDRGGELTMQFDFVLMQRLYLALARQEPGPVVAALRSRPTLDPDSQWATFVRNHDELTLDKLTEEERQEVFEAFGPEESMQLYGRGLRRRLPPMLDGDQRRLRMVYSLLFSLPGTPVLFYGEEIGMGEELSVEGRLAVRTAMQWTPDGGFSTADPARWVRAMTSGPFGPTFVDVASQRRDRDSLLSFVSLLVRRYRECPELGWGSCTVVEQPCASVLVMLSTWDDASLVSVHNLAPEAADVPLELDGLPEGTRLVDLLEDGAHEVPAEGPLRLPVDGYGYRWLRVVRPGDRRLV